SQDIGIMQINTRWLPVLKAHGIGREDLFDACLNIFVGAWVLAGNIERFGPTWEAVGAYNAASRNKRRRYVHKIWKAWNGG
ncbi:MAG: lytic transglycosylase, partial [Gammaproteobacteria bacterium]